MKFNVYCERCKKNLFEAQLFDAELQSAYIAPHDCSKKKEINIPKRRSYFSDCFGSEKLTRKGMKI